MAEFFPVSHKLIIQSAAQYAYNANFTTDAYEMKLSKYAYSSMKDLSI